MSKEIDLKPCPFCGGAGKIKGLNSTAIYVRCCLCGCRTGSRRDIRKAIEVWNTRATPIPDTPEMVSALDDAYEAGIKSIERTCKMIPNGDTDFAATLACSVCGNVESVYASTIAQIAARRWWSR